ncbi:hypothetical protein [Gordonia sputi]|uniref:hypothetical protein n=1 Tax=Gordonia sputi TaxID=36823 RepID=UPI003681159C
MDQYEWGQASVAYPDWQGTVQLDEKMTGDDSVYSMTGVDREQWTIIGLDLGGGESGMHALEVVVVPRGTDLGASRLEATMIRIHNVDALGVLQRMMHVFDMRMRIRSTLDASIVVTDLGDIPEQG